MKTLALIAHDNKKVDMVAWATFNRTTFRDFRLLATSHTAQVLREKVGLDVEPLLSGARGGMRRSPRSSPRNRWMRCSSSWTPLRPCPMTRTSGRCSACAMSITCPWPRMWPPRT